jgi:ATP-dependent DNA helicase RecG
VTSAELHDYISLGEGFTIEFKRSLTTSISRELCAFANSSGGYVFIGVEDSGVICGVRNHNKLKSELQSIARSFDPALIIDVESVDTVLVVYVPPQNSKPYSFSGKFYLRDGASSQQMNRNEIREFFFQEGVIHFDETPCDSYNLQKDLTKEMWQSFIKKAKIPENIKPMQVLENLHLKKDDKLTYAGAWMLAKDITKYSISAKVLCALFMGTTRTNILDRQEYTDDLYSIYRNIINYLQAKLNTEFIITATGRIERLELPVDALREAVVNALAHRDYRSSACTQVHIFRDRVEIISPGGLPAGMTKKDMGRKSIPRNPLLFGIFFRMDVVEQLGSGIKRILELSREYGTPEPVIETDNNWVTITFPRDPAKAGIPEESEGPVEGPVGGPVEGPVSLSVLKQKILLQCEKADSSKDELLKVMDMKASGYFKRSLSELIKNVYLEYTIPEKPGSRLQKYRLTEKGESLIEELDKTKRDNGNERV